MARSRHRRSRPFGLVALGMFAVVVLASCDPGWVNPIAGDGTAGVTTGMVAQAHARFTDPTGVVAIPGGGFYVYDAATCAIYRDDSQRQVSVYAGTPGTCGNSGDGGLATAATLDNSPAADSTTHTSLRGPGHDARTPMALGPGGNLYFVELSIVGWQAVPSAGTSFPEYQSQVRRITPAGTVTAVGNGIANSATDFIVGVTKTPDGTILVAVVHNGGGTTEIAQISADGTQATVTTTPGLVYAIAAISDAQVATLTSSSVDRVDLTTGIATSTGHPSGLLDGVLTAAPNGTIYVGSAAAETIVRIAPDNIVTTIAGNGTADPGTSAQMGPGLSLQLTPSGLALTPNNGLLVSSGHVVYRLNDPADAGVLALGSPLNYLGGCASYHVPAPTTTTSSSPTSPAITAC